MDAFANLADQVSAPATRAVAVVPSDITMLGDVPKAIYVGRGGTLVLRGADGGDSVWRGVADGTVLPFRARGVRATGTTATDLLALY